jgi:hypothetical protein
MIIGLFLVVSAIVVTVFGLGVGYMVWGRRNRRRSELIRCWKW